MKGHKGVFRDSIKSLGLLTIHSFACFSARINYDKIAKHEKKASNCISQHWVLQPWFGFELNASIIIHNFYLCLNFTNMLSKLIVSVLYETQWFVQLTCFNLWLASTDFLYHSLPVAVAGSSFNWLWYMLSCKQAHEQQSTNYLNICMADSWAFKTINQENSKKNATS